MLTVWETELRQLLMDLIKSPLLLVLKKMYGDLATTLEIVRKNTAPLNAHRLGLKKTPCIQKGICGDCLQMECICNTIAITRRSMMKDRIFIYLIIDDVGL